DLQTELKTLQSKQTNAFTVFGRWVQPLLDKIEVAFQQNLFKKKPIGPLGAYIEVLDSGWAHIAEQVIGVNISAFCVDNQDDAQVLDSLFESTKPSKIISRFRPRHDARLIAEHSVMSSTYKSLWSILKISNDVVANILIDRYQLETTLLIPTADEAGAILKDRNTVPQNCKLAYTLRGDRYFPDPNYRVYSGHGSTQTRFLQTSVADKARAVESDISRLKYESDRVAAELKTLSGECAELRRQEKDSNQKLNGKKVKVRSLRQKLTELEGQEEPPPPSLSLLEEDIKKQEAYLADATDALSKTKEQIQVTTAEFTVANGAYSEAMRSIEQTKEEANDIMEKIKNLIAKEKEMKRTESLLKQQMKKQVEKTNETEKRHTEMQEKLQKETEAANNLLPRIDTDR
ncbi:Structural maintenance of chromosomes protein 6, partial [Halocaridina rubra]